VVLGGDAAGATTLDGAIGDVRLAPTAWTAGEAAFDHGNLSSPGTVVSDGPASGGTWFDQGDWATRRPLTVDAGLVATTLADYPLLVQLADTDLGLGTQNDGDDLVFVAADGVTRLDHEIEAWDRGSGTLTAWVRIPILDATDDTEIFLYLDNPSAVDQSDPEGVWGPDADLVLLGN
jgi:biopolymer transport protein ExbB